MARSRFVKTFACSVVSFAIPLTLCLALFSNGVKAAQQSYLFYVGTYTEHGSKGIYAYRFDAATGAFTSLGLAAESAQPSFLAVAANGKSLYAVNELESYKGQPTGAVSAFAIQSDPGKLSLLNQLSSRGQDPAHITLDQSGKYALVANYTSGSVAVFPVLADGHMGEASAFVQHKGSSVDPERQKGPHAHAIALSPDNRFAIVADLGLDELIEYRFDAAKGTLGSDPLIVKTKPGAGPRHLVFGPGGRFLYVIDEMQSAVVTYSYDEASGKLRELQTISTLPNGFTGSNTDAEIEVHPSGKFVFASSRGHDSIAVFAVDPTLGTLTLVEIDSTRGKTPRNFALDPTGSWLLAANEDSNDVVEFRIDQATGHLTPTTQQISVSSPVCIRFVPNK